MSLSPSLSKLLINGFHVKVQLSPKFGLKVPRLSSMTFITMKPGVVKDEIQIKVAFTHLQQHLFSHVCETGSQFDKKLGDMPNQSLFQLSLVVVLCQSEKIEGVRVFDNLLSQI